MKRIFLFKLALTGVIAATMAPLVGAQASVAGDWQGTLSVSGAQLRLGLHIKAAKDGGLTATVDSIDEGSMGIPITAIALKDSKLTFTWDAEHIAYEGTVNKDATEIDGIFTKGQDFPLNFKRAEAKPAAQTRSIPAAPSPIDGTWLGSLDTGAIKLRIVFKIVNTADGLTVQLQSPDQSTAWMSATSVTRNESALTVTFKGIGAVYEGKIAADSNSIDGTFTQMGNPLPLTFRRIKDQSELELKRPQNPVKPYPYREEDATYKSAGNTLAATLTIPAGQGPFPAVLLIAGSGPHDRDESLLGHKPFLVLSDYLTRKGIVVLRADKRGVGKSTGDYAKATTADFAADAEAGVAYLKTRPEVDQRKIGILGHSEGGIVAPMVAVADPSADPPYLRGRRGKQREGGRGCRKGTRNPGVGEERERSGDAGPAAWDQAGCRGNARRPGCCRNQAGHLALVPLLHQLRPRCHAAQAHHSRACAQRLARSAGAAGAEPACHPQGPGRGRQSAR